jgi:hypothetical protein
MAVKVASIVRCKFPELVTSAGEQLVPRMMSRASEPTPEIPSPGIALE